MAAENKPKAASAVNKGKKRKQYLPYNKPVKKRGAYPLRPGVQGFFITCDGGRERQAAHEAINVIDTFYEELVHGKDYSEKLGGLPDKTLNKKITFSYSDDDGDEEEEEDNDDAEEDDDEVREEEEQDGGSKSDTCRGDDATHENPTKETNDSKEDRKSIGNQADEAKEPPSKKQCLETDTSNCGINGKEEKSVDKLIEAELEELGDKSKRRFLNLDSGCNGVVFVQMRKRDGDPSLKDIVQHMMTSAASTKKHMSRFILRVLPIEVACYASEEEISGAMKSLVEQYFPAETQNPQKFAVLYEARANTGVDRMKIINSVAKSVPAPHKVDLSNPDMTIVVEIVKTVCLIGVVEKYKELAKFNLRQLTSSK
ncbi:hypothetical protein SLEP1_g27190 [Rubroshorea leprosula]|uniref:THUMP domain-containing protein n=1 Tax=Rubroshorea leprosula TaxID=152421 RepID=A0AAV5JYA2_9ROSI|nr:hypothetical protein SLEP1_g27190 [Rubroshorea leprosula]